MAQNHFFTFFANTKGRWVGKPLLPVLVDEFNAETRAYYEAAIEIGAIKVNDRITSPDHKLETYDKITHFVHMHERDCPEIEILAEENGLVVVNKPAGIPCHPTSRYRRYCVLGAVGRPGLRCLHRLDLLTSGLLLLATPECKVSLDGAQKVYIARVRGLFPDEATVDKRILVCHNYSSIDDRGKEACTVFRRIAHKDNESLVECTLRTGRSHQIRVHLKSIGFPIVNDPLYGDAPKRERVYEKCSTSLDGLNNLEAFAIANCKGMETSHRNSDMFIHLHSHRYFLCGRWYVAELPAWAHMDAE